MAAAFAALAACCIHVEAATLRFSLPEGRVLNEFYRQGPVAAHVVVTPGSTPRLIVAFPAGNSGAAVWFGAHSAALSWHRAVNIHAACRELPDGSVLRGITAELSATGGPVAITQAIASSVRVIRQYEDTGAAPPEVLVQPRVSGRKIVWERRRLDGAAGYYLSIEVLDGKLDGPGEAPLLELAAGTDGELRLRITALTGDPPLTPIEENDLLMNAQAGQPDSRPGHSVRDGQAGARQRDVRLRHILAFLSYDEKLLAGSWRFNTYFGRDTLMSLQLLAAALQPRVVEAGLGAVLERLNASGEVAHEEDIGEFAVLRRMRAGLPPDDERILDYKMIDDDFMLAIVAAHYLMETPAGHARAATFLARRTDSGSTYGERLVRNLRLVLSKAAPFAREPDWRHLIGLKPGEHAGNWRDSEDGLGGGRYPYDVNGVLVAAALDAIGQLRANSVLQPYLDADDRAALSQAAAMAEVWLRDAPHLFDVEVPSRVARAAAQEYARRIRIDPAPVLDALGPDAVRLRAVALDARGRPIPVLNSDEALALLLLDPAPQEAERIANTLTRAFPAGLMTDVGLVVANPAYAPAAFQPRFDRNHYHGTVIWSWQQAVLAAGLRRQLGRTDLTSSARAALMRAHGRLSAAIEAADAVRGSELWSWSEVDGHYRVEPFGQRDGDETESNAAQLWSTVHLVHE